MAFAQWMRVLDTLSGLVQMGSRMRRGDEPTGLQTGAGGGPLGLIEARLAGVVVAALKEAFDRDSTRLELERSQIEAERQRAEAALQAELKVREALLESARALSAALGAWLPGMRDGSSRMLLGLGWLFAIGALGAAFAGWQQISRWSADSRGLAFTLPAPGAAAFAPWLLLLALALTGASLLTAF